MTNGERYALQIIVADKLGIDVGFVDYAKNLYENGIDIPDCFGGYFAQEASEAVRKINEKGLKDVAEELFNEYKNKIEGL